MKFNVTGLWDASKHLGVVEAETAEEAKQKALNTDWDGKEYVSLCHQCADELEVGDMTDVLVYPVEGANE